MNHYETLGIGEQATPEEIKRAYRKLASQHHPDKGGDTQKFQEIQSAYDTLADPDKRQHYDHERRNPGMGPGGVHFQWNAGSPDISEIFRQFNMGGDPFAAFRQQQQPRRNKDLRVELPVSLVETLTEQSKTINVRTNTGHQETVQVKIPRGITSGSQIKYPGLGDTLFEILPRGDLYVQISVQTPVGYDIHGIDLYHRTSVNCLVAVVGGTITVDTIDNKTFELTIPPGTQPGTRFRIGGQGLYQMDADRRGDLYVEFNIFVPQNLSPQHIDTIRSLLNQ